MFSQDRHGRDRLRPDAAERLGHVHHPEAAGGMARSRRCPRTSWSSAIEAAVEALPGNNYEFTQPIQMRFNELIAGVRGDVAVKVFGDDFEPMLQAANQIAGILRGIDGRGDVKVEQIDGPAVPRDRHRQGGDRAARPEPRRRAGRDRHRGRRARGRAWCSRATGASRSWSGLPKRVRSDIDALQNLPVPLPRVDGGRSRPRSIPLQRGRARSTLTEGPNQISRENGKRRVVVKANVRGRDIGSFVARGAGEDRAAGQPAAGLLADLGRAVREPRRGARSG